jgi:hypothetical protein
MHINKPAIFKREIIYKLSNINQQNVGTRLRSHKEKKRKGRRKKRKGTRRGRRKRGGEEERKRGR